MPTTFQIADEECTQQLGKVMERHHPRLAEAGVKVGVLMAFNPEGDAVRHGGYPAFASIRVVALRDRVTKGYDAEMLIDETQWQSMSEAHRAALLDHELSHLSLVPMSAKQLAEARANNSAAPDWKLDDLGRPKLKLVKGDWNAGDGFRDVVARHGKVAIEFANIASAKAMADAAASGEAGNGDDIA